MMFHLFFWGKKYNLLAEESNRGCGLLGASAGFRGRRGVRDRVEGPREGDGG